MAALGQVRSGADDAVASLARSGVNPFCAELSLLSGPKRRPSETPTIYGEDSDSEDFLLTEVQDIQVKEHANHKLAAVRREAQDQAAQSTHHQFCPQAFCIKMQAMNDVLPSHFVLSEDQDTSELATLVQSVKKDNISKYQFVSDHFDFLSRKGRQLHSIGEQLVAYLQSVQESCRVTKETTTKWNPELTTVKDLLKDVKNLKEEFQNGSEQLLARLNKLDDTNLLILISNVNGSDQSYAAFQDQMNRENAQLQEQQTKLHNLMRQSEQLTYEHELLKSALTDALAIKRGLELELQDLGQRRQQVKSDSKACLEQVMKDINEKKRELHAHVSMYGDTQGGLRQLELDMETKAEEAFRQVAESEFRMEKDVKPRTNHIIFLCQSSAAAGKFAPYMKEGLKHFFLMRNNARVDGWNADLVSFVKFGAGGTQIVSRADGWEEAVENFHTDASALEASHDANLSETLSELQELIRGRSSAQVCSFRLFLILDADLSPDDLLASAESAKLIRSTALHTIGASEPTTLVSSHLFLLGKVDMPTSQLTPILSTLNGVAEVHAKIYKLPQPCQTLNLFDALSQSLVDESVSKWRGLASVTKKWTTFTNRRMEFSEQKRQAQRAEILRQLNDLGKQGDDAKSYVDSVNHNFTLYLESETKYLSGLLEEAKVTVEAAQKKESEVKFELQEVSKRLPIQEDQVNQLAAASTTDEIHAKLKQRRQALLKLAAFNQDEIKATGNSFLSLWTEMRSCFRDQHEVFSISLKANEKYLSNLAATTTPKMDQRAVLNQLIQKYLDDGIIQENSLGKRQENWATIVHHHCKRADDEEVEGFTNLVRLRDLLGPDGVVNMETLQDSILEELQNDPEYESEQAEIDDAESDIKKLKAELKQLEKDKKEVDQADRDEMKSIDKDIKDKNKEICESTSKKDKLVKALETKVKKGSKGKIKMLTGVREGVLNMHEDLELAQGAPEFCKKVEDGVRIYTEHAGPALLALTQSASVFSSSSNSLAIKAALTA